MCLFPRLTRWRARITAAAVLAPFLCIGAAAQTDSGTTAPDAPAPAPDASTSHVENSVVKVFATRRGYDLGKPWTKQAPSDVSGTGVVIEGHRILTNAHIVLYASQVQIQGNQSGDKISATVEAIAPGIDLAVLKVDDDSFFTTRPPLPRADTLPEVKDSVLAFGFPTGGTSLSITKGIVSRIEFVNYFYLVSGLRVQIDAAINPGNSGGPAVIGDKMVGLAYSTLNGAQNIGYIIPCEEIELFLHDIASGQYHGKPRMFADFQTLENPALRAFLKLDKSVEGMIVRQPISAEPGYPLKQWDVITKIGDTPIDDQGKIKLGTNLRVSFLYLVQKIAKDGKLALTVVRAGHEIAVQLPVSPHLPLVLQYLEGAYPSYFIYGPITFMPATEDYFIAVTSGSNAASAHAALEGNDSPLVTRQNSAPAFEGEELVVVPAPFFPHLLAKGYTSPVGQVVRTVNGIAIKNLRHLVEVLRDAKGEFITIEFADRYTEAIVFPRREMVAATEEILSDNGVRAQGSPDMLEVWNAKTKQ